MRPATAWRDPAFYAYLLFGLLLLCSSLACRVRAAQSGPDRPTAHAGPAGMQLTGLAVRDLSSP
ncbi:MAG: hypothetical protein HYU66_07780 [Armatimonadetes bacterium]|nr:hypothetical protein [Armatimonadota bacterium]